MTRLWTAQNVDYRPPRPSSTATEIGLVGCGAITELMLAAYRSAGFNVTALCDPIAHAAEARCARFFPDARVFSDHRELLDRTQVEVVDVATHTDVRPAIVSDCLQAGRHVLSQKPFVEDIGVGERLCDLADRQGVKLAVNQNGRWAPHFSFLRTAVLQGLIGDVSSADFSVYWSHDRDVAGSRFADMPDLILLDFGIHWFDLVSVLFAGHGPARTVFANVGRSAKQQMSAPAHAQVLIDFDDAQASLVFRGAASIAEEGLYRVTGTEGVISSRGPVLGGHEVRVDVAEGTVDVPLQGHWFREGFQGSMGELLRSIEADEEPANAARKVLGGLQLCFAAVVSSRDGLATDPGQVRMLSA
jgi:predicted dehydrogenase